MKKRIFSLLTAITMIATLAGCGSDTVNETDPPEETEVPNICTLGEALGEDTAKSEDVAYTEDDFSESYRWDFPEGMEGYTDKWIFKDHADWSHNQTHSVAIEGTEMNFIWEGPTALGETAEVYENILRFGDSEGLYTLDAWYGGDIDQEKFNQDLTFDKETWVSFASPYIPYAEDGYYDIQTTDTTIEVIFEVVCDVAKGYNYYIVDLANGICYQFEYLENTDIYDDTRAMNVIDSIKYWSDYTPE